MKEADKKTIKCQRLCVDGELKNGSTVSLDQAHVHYLKNVMRMPEGAHIRVFNGRDGEWLAGINYEGKKSASLHLEEKLAAQPDIKRRVCLVFAPIKKARMDFLIEKAVELGAHELQPVLTQNTEVRVIKEDRIRQQIREAAEQCERLDIPALSPLISLHNYIAQRQDSPVLACLERQDTPHISDVIVQMEGDVAVLVGPEGGFTAEEMSFIEKTGNIRPVSLGRNVLRSETACLVALSFAGQ